MSKELKLTKIISINASAEKVWECLTDPVSLKRMYYGCEVITDWKTGSRILFKGNWQGTDFCDGGTILNAEPGKFYEYDYFSHFSGLPDIPENYSVIKFEVENENGNCKLTLTHSHFATQTMYEHSDKNWDMALAALKKRAEE